MIAELVEHEQWVVAGATKVPVVGAAFLSPVRLANAAVHVQHDGRLWTPRMHSVDPGARQISQRGEIDFAGEPTGLETAHLAGRGSLTIQAGAIHNGAHRGIMGETIGVVHVFIPVKAAEHGLAKQAGQQVPGVPASATLAPARSVSPSASSNSRYASNPASEVIRVPWNSSLRRRSKSTRRDPSSASPVGCDIADHSTPCNTLNPLHYRYGAYKSEVIHLKMRD